MKNVRFPYTSVAIHRSADDELIPAVSPADLTTVGHQNVTFFQQDETWTGPVFFGNATSELRFFANKSVASDPILLVNPRNISLDGRSTTILLPTFESICGINGEATSITVQCPARIWLSMTDTVTGGNFNSQYIQRYVQSHSLAGPPLSHTYA